MDFNWCEVVHSTKAEYGDACRGVQNAMNDGLQGTSVHVLLLVYINFFKHSYQSIMLHTLYNAQN